MVPKLKYEGAEMQKTLANELRHKGSRKRGVNREKMRKQLEGKVRLALDVSIFYLCPLGSLRLLQGLVLHAVDGDGEMVQCRESRVIIGIFRERGKREPHHQAQGPPSEVVDVVSCN